MNMLFSAFARPCAIMQRSLHMRYSATVFFALVLSAVAFWSGVLFASCSGDSSSNSDVISLESSSDAVAPESSEANPKSSASVPKVLDSATSPKSATSPESTSTRPKSSTTTAAADTIWNKANLTWYISWPDPGSEECVKYNGCQWAGYFAGLENQQTEEWVSQHNIISIHEKDWDKYMLKTFRLRQNGRYIDAVVYDKCSDSDCDGCCTQNAGQLGFLIDIESYSCERLTGDKEGCDGVVEWVCLDCE